MIDCPKEVLPNSKYLKKMCSSDIHFKLFLVLYFLIPSKIPSGHRLPSNIRLYTHQKLGMQRQTHKRTDAAKHKKAVGTVCHQIVLKHVEWIKKGFWG